MVMMQCDACGAMMDPKGLTVREKKQEDELEVSYIRCGRCGKEYVISVTDGKLRRMQKKIRRDARAIRAVKMTQEEKNRRIRKLGSRKKNAEEYGAKLKAQYLEAMADDAEGKTEQSEMEDRAGVSEAGEGPGNPGNRGEPAGAAQGDHAGQDAGPEAVE